MGQSALAAAGGKDIVIWGQIHGRIIAIGFLHLSEIVMEAEIQSHSRKTGFPVREIPWNNHQLLHHCSTNNTTANSRQWHLLQCASREKTPY